jgi:hypothetical protein
MPGSPAFAYWLPGSGRRTSSACPSLRSVTARGAAFNGGEAVEPAGISIAEAAQHRPEQRQRMPPRRQASRPVVLDHRLAPLCAGRVT